MPIVMDRPATAEMDWARASTVTAGVDIGASSAKLVILADNHIVAYSHMVRAGDTVASAQKVLQDALKAADMKLENIHNIVATGYGRVLVPYARRNMSEVSCHARGAHWFFPGARTVMDMGAQDCKAIRCDSQGKVTDFFVNEKCAAGCGRYMEVIAEILEVPLEEVGRLSLETKREPPDLSTSCVLFAKSEALALLGEGVSRNELLAAYCNCLAHIVANQLGRIGIEKDLVLTGGIARNMGLVARLEKILGAEAHIPFEPVIAGALGAALFARDMLRP